MTRLSAPAHFQEPRWWPWLLLYLGFVVYGSLVPLELRPLTFDAAVARFASIGFLDLGVASRADWVANIVLYVPLAFLGCVTLLGLRAQGAVAVAGATAVFAAGVAVAVAVEFVQLFFAPRTVSLNDLLAETIGSAIGTLLWLFGRWRIVGLGIAFARGGRASIVAALAVLLVAYLLLSLVPYDFVVSAAELKVQLETGAHAWVSRPCGRWLRCLAFWLAEVAAVAPMALLLALLYPRWPLSRFLFLGLALGLMLEPLQVLLVSGKAQGLSVPLRGLGALLGALLARWLTLRLGLDALPRIAWRAVPFALPPYLLALTALSGWWEGPWADLSQALGRLGRLNWAPFYYHYWTTEPVAMLSLLSQLAMYMPVGAVFWARSLALPGARTPGWAPAGAALLLALVIEAGKLFAPGARPDPTNLLIAPVGAWLAYAAGLWFARALRQVQGERAGVVRGWPAGAERPETSLQPGAAHQLAGGLRGPTPDGARSGSAELDREPGASPVAGPIARSGRGARTRAAVMSGEPLPEPTVLGYLYALGAGGVAVTGLMLYPSGQLWLGAALLAFGAALWRWPWLWLVVVPAALPVLDLTPWSGQVLLTAFELFVLVGLAVVGLRLSGLKPARLPNAWIALSLLLLWLSWLVSTAVGLAPSAGGGLPLASSHSAFAPWHEGKGLLWALLAVPLLRRFRRQLGSTAAATLVLGGAAIGLALASATVLAERAAYVGLLNFATAFRVTGPFSSMHDGGGYIGAYLAFALPMLVGWILVVKRRWLKLGGVVLVPLAAYALLVTFARGGYVGAATGLAVLVLGLLLAGQVRTLRQWSLLGGALAMVVFVSVHMLTGGFAGDRLSRIEGDLRARLMHWQHALGLLGDGVQPMLVGAGFGRYPALYLFAEQAGTPPGTFEVIKAGDDTLLRLGRGQAVYLDQRVSLRAGTDYRLAARVRGAEPDARLSVMLCEKALLYSFTCVRAALAPDKADVWQRREATLATGEVGRGGRWPHGPVKLSLYNAGKGRIDVDDVSLVAPDGRELIANGDFSRGAARWLFVTDQAQGWHIDQLFIETFVAQGSLGLLALALLLVAAAAVLWPGMRAGRLEAVAFAAALAGLVSAGLFGSVVDAPRTGMLFYLGLLCAALLVRGADKRRRARRAAKGETLNNGD